jgi:predicted HTH transcriptional regulator
MDPAALELSGESSEKTSEIFLNIVRENRQVTIAELADLVGITTRSVERNIKKLQDAGQLKRMGPDKKAALRLGLQTWNKGAMSS